MPSPTPPPGERVSGRSLFESLSELVGAPSPGVVSPRDAVSCKNWQTWGSMGWQQGSSGAAKPCTLLVWLEEGLSPSSNQNRRVNGLPAPLGPCCCHPMDPQVRQFFAANCWPETCEAILARSKTSKTQDPRRLTQLSSAAVPCDGCLCAMDMAPPEHENPCPGHLLPATVAQYGFHSSVQKIYRDWEGKFHFKFSQCEIATGQMIEYTVLLESASVTREAHPHRLVLPPNPPAKRTRTSL